MHVESLGKPHNSTSAPKALSGKLDIKIHSHSILYMWCVIVANPGYTHLCFCTYSVIVVLVCGQ